MFLKFLNLRYALLDATNIIISRKISFLPIRARSLNFWGRRGGYFWADFESHSGRNACIVTDVSFEICQKDPDKGNHSDQPLYGLSRQDRNEFTWKYTLHSNISTCYRQTSNVDNLSAVISIEFFNKSYRDFVKLS